MIKITRPASHPGVYIKDAIEELELSQNEFALRTGLTGKNVSTLINGESDITFGVAIKLAAFFGNSVEGWLNLQTKYDLWIYQNKKQKEYTDDWEIAKMFDKNFVQRYLGVSFNSKDKETTIDDLRSCFNVATLQNLQHSDMYAFYKTSVQKELSKKTIILRNAWVSIAEKKARKLECSSFDKSKIIDNKIFLRSLTLLNPEEFMPKLTKFLSDSGVKLVVLPYLSGSNVSGVTKWLSNESAVLVAVNDCGKDADKFWFALFHELGHAIKNHKRHMTISYLKDNIEDEEEIEANTFASNLLIDPDKYGSFVGSGQFDLRSIQEFAKKQKVADFIVVGRLQKDGYFPWSTYPDTKIKYKVIF